MTGVKTVRPRRRTSRRAKASGATIVLYAALIVAGILLFRAGAAYAYAERGYRALGGEVFALFIPALYYFISQAISTFITDMKNIKEEKNHEKTC